MGIYLYVIEPELIERACRKFIELSSETATPWRVEDVVGFNKALGLSKEVYIEYKRTGKLRVNGVTYKKIELLASGNTAHWQTLFKMIEAKYGTKAETDCDGEHGGPD